ncbi:MAG: polysaccharide biosynthesis tyrosine autokinase [Candidatus Omnitrophica bacterium]|nr:polysaccharide biosynthesis tyrosine autokinase [Candidatus Omnitrophota bacterium]
MDTATPSPNPSFVYEVESSEFRSDYRRYFHLINRHINLVVTLLIMGATLASIYVSRLTDEYKATAQILLERPRGTPATPQPMIVPDIWEEDYYNTQKEIMLGATVLRQVVDELKLIDYFHVSGVDEAVNRLLKDHLAVERVRRSRLFNVTATSSDPQFSTALANSVTRAYIRKNFEDLLYFSKEIFSWVPQEGSDVVTVQDPFGEVKQISREELVNTLPSIRTDPTVRELEQKKSDIEVELTTLLKQYREKHPLVVKAQSNLTFIEQSLEVEKMKVLEDLKQQAEGRLQVSNARIIEEAEAPKSPSGPPRVRIVLMAVAAELVVVFLLLLIWDYFDDTIHSPDDLVQKGIGVPFLGPVPLIKEFDFPEKERFLITHYHRRSHVAESFRYLRVAINFSAPPETLKTLVFTSSLPNEGKSFVAHNMAVSLAQDGNRTLFIDADMRKPVAHRVYRMENVAGLSNFLTSNISVDTIIRETFVENLWIMTSGPESPNPAEILNSKRMKDLLEVIRGRFDRIIIDAPPLTGIGDSLILGSITTHVVMVVRSAKTDVDIIKASKELLERAGIRVIGAVLNGVDIEKERYSGYYKHYYHSYNRYYAPEAADKKEK